MSDFMSDVGESKSEVIEQDVATITIKQCNSVFSISQCTIFPQILWMEKDSCAGIISQCHSFFPPLCLLVTGLWGTFNFFWMCHHRYAAAVNLHVLVQSDISLWLPASKTQNPMILAKYVIFSNQPQLCMYIWRYLTQQRQSQPCHFTRSLW